MPVLARKPPIDIQPHRPRLCLKCYLTSQRLVNEASKSAFSPTSAHKVVYVCILYRVLGLGFSISSQITCPVGRSEADDLQAACLFVVKVMNTNLDFNLCYCSLYYLALNCLLYNITSLRASGCRVLLLMTAGFVSCEGAPGQVVMAVVACCAEQSAGQAC